MLIALQNDPNRNRATQRISLFSEPGPPEAILTLAYKPIIDLRTEPAQRQT